MEKFYLKWSDFQSNISKSFQSLRNKKDFSDATLVGDDFKQITAHKIILSSCSVYFNNILKNIGDNNHTIVCLEGMSSEDIEKVMDYVYNGELKIYQNDIDRFLVVGQRLGLEGLIGMEASSKESALEEIYAAQTIKHLDESYEVEEQSIVNKGINKTACNKDKILMSNTRKYNMSNTSNQIIVSFAHGSSIDSMEELKKKVEESYSRENDGQFSCHYCKKLFKWSSHAKEHVEVHFDGLSLNCNYCEKTFRSRYSLRQHTRTHRK